MQSYKNTLKMNMGIPVIDKVYYKIAVHWYFDQNVSMIV